MSESTATMICQEFLLAVTALVVFTTAVKCAAMLLNYFLD
jgi:hypothetical protein